MTEIRSIATNLRGPDVLNDPAINKGTAFTTEERSALGLHGLLPPRLESIDDQMARIRTKYDVLHTDLERHIFLRALQDTNEVLFYAFVAANLTETMPIIYTPTVGVACQQFSHIYRRPHGLFLSYLDRHRLDELLDSVDHDVDVVVVTDGQRILGLGDQGLGGMGIPIGKLSLYTAVGGIDPGRALPVLLDVGTDNPDLLADPLYLGWRNPRISGRDYGDFVEAFVSAVERRFPGVLVQWEDFASDNAAPLLARYRDRLLSFNDDIQGTAAVGLATVLAGLAVSDLRLDERPIMIVGAGSAGVGIATMAIDTIARQTGASDHGVYVVDRRGVLHDGRDDLDDYQRPVVRPRDDAWADTTDLVELITVLQPAVLIGVTGVGGLFGEDVIRALAAVADRPVVMPLSNPTSKAEATPADIVAWTDGRALVATGSPFEPVAHDGATITISQANNVYVFPGLGLGALAAGATRVTDAMLEAAAAAVAERGAAIGSPADGLLPPLSRIHEVSRRIAVDVAVAAGEDGSAPPIDRAEAERRVAEQWWSPVYPTVEAA